MIRELIATMRPTRWTKNVTLLAALMFSRNFTEPDMLLRSLAALALFCMVSSAGYIFNDITDRKEDRHHPEKKNRPIASGRVPIGASLPLCLILGMGGLAGSFALDSSFGVWVLGYMVLMILYSLYLKRVPIVEIFIQAAGLMIRVVAGGVVIHVEISNWLINCTMLLALFLTLSRRRHDLLITADTPNKPRILESYSPYLMDQMIAVVTSATLIAYTLYTISEETVQKFGTAALILTVPFVLYGIFRYLYLIHQKKSILSPEREMLADVPFMVNFVLYILVAAAVLYGVPW